MSSLLNYKCPNCGGRLEFDSKSQMLKCPFCESEFRPETFEEDVNQTYKYEDDSNVSSDLLVYVCNSCNGTIMADRNTIATSCPYCGNPVVMQENQTAELKPDAIIPFKLDKKAAVSQFRKHLLGRPLLPKAFRDKDHIEEIKGVYVPFWLFNGTARVDSSLSAEKVRSWSDYNYHYTETSYFDVQRSASIDYEDVPVDGSRKLDDKLTQSLEVFESIDLVPYKSAYLAGYYAEKYDMTDGQVKNVAYERIKKTLSDEIEASIIGYDSVRTVASHLHVTNEKIIYALYPIWLLTTRYKDKDYLFAMNGQTGKFVGDLPVDKGLQWRYAILIFLGVSLALTLLVYAMTVGF